MKKSLLLLTLSIALTNAVANDIDFAKESEKYKNEVLTLGQNVAFLITPGKDPYFNVYQPDIDTFKVIKLGYFDDKNNSIKKPEQLENIIVLNEMINTYSANIRITNKYQGSRESFLSENLANTFLGKKFYNGKIIIDEYNQNIPMFWVLNNVKELRALSKYIMKNISLENKNTTLFSLEKPLLVVKIMDDPNFQTLTKDDILFLNTYFNIFSLNDKDIKKFFDTAKNKMLDRGSNMANPRIKGESILESIFRQTEKQYSEWKAKDWAIAAGVTVVATNTYNFLKPEVQALGKLSKKYLGINWAVKKAKGDKNTIIENITGLELD